MAAINEVKLVTDGSHKPRTGAQQPPRSTRRHNAALGSIIDGILAAQHPLFVGCDRLLKIKLPSFFLPSSPSSFLLTFLHFVSKSPLPIVLKSSILNEVSP